MNCVDHVLTVFTIKRRHETSLVNLTVNTPLHSFTFIKTDKRFKFLIRLTTYKSIFGMFFWLLVLVYQND